MSDDVKLSTELNKIVLSEKCQSEEKFQPIEPLFKDMQNGITFRQYIGESDLNNIIHLIASDLSEPYSIYTYRYFIYNWPKLCLLAVSEDGTCVGTIVCKMEGAIGTVRKGYIAMLAVEENHRRIGIGSRLAQLAIELMIQDKCDEYHCTVFTFIRSFSVMLLFVTHHYPRYSSILKFDNNHKFSE
ncbi:unnamed protein product [Schistosoma margrebowiei]|uniref:Uncharacterized protein n=1 Tax=Schistosoma margrebowiei TaxID=48269 RepID=A0A183M1T9_9TREM|nr:unnamed protein product [Schistosoma margrebowiei]